MPPHFSQRQARSSSDSPRPHGSSASGGWVWALPCKGYDLRPDFDFSPEPASDFARDTGWSEDDLVIRGKRGLVTKSIQATAAGSSETFEDFYEREFRSVVGLAYALSG